MSDVQTRDALGRFVLGMTPHNKKWSGKCRIDGCDRTDMKAHGLCHKHYKLKQLREKNGVFSSDLSKRLPRTEEHKRNNIAYTKRPDYVNGLKGRTFEDIYGDRADEVRKKIGDSQRGKKRGPSPKRGIPLSEETKKKLSIAMAGRSAKDKNYFWKGGSSYEKYGFEFTLRLKEVIRNRDNRMCVLCKAHESILKTKLCVHHIDYNKNNNKENNLVSLCRKCHANVHWSKDEWSNHLRNVLKPMEVNKCH